MTPPLDFAGGGVPVDNEDRGKKAPDFAKFGTPVDESPGVLPEPKMTEPTHVGSAIAKGYREGFEAMPPLLAPGAQAELDKVAKAGGFKGAGATALSGLLNAARGPLGIVPGLYRGIQAGVIQQLTELGVPEQAARDIASVPDAILPMLGGLRGGARVPEVSQPRVEPGFGEPPPGPRPGAPTPEGPTPEGGARWGVRAPQLTGPRGELVPTSSVPALDFAAHGTPEPAPQLAISAPSSGPPTAPAAPWLPVAEAPVEQPQAEQPVATESAPEQAPSAEAPTAATPVETPASTLKPGDRVTIGDATHEVEQVRPWTGDQVAVKLKGDPKLLIGPRDAPVVKVPAEPTPEDAAQAPVEAFGGPWTPVLDKEGEHATNLQGAPLYENPNGVRAMMDAGVPHTERTKEHPEKGLLPHDVVNRKGQFLTKDETGQAGPKPAAKPKPANSPAHTTTAEKPEKPAAPGLVSSKAETTSPVGLEPTPHTDSKPPPESKPEKPSTEEAKPEASKPRRAKREPKPKDSP